ncbi:MAG: DNA-3-methyladenine glycosylase [Bdellovibrionales bacterium]|nr:DNA-3-methyladenine glycosylase [Bdellovibrionales bacterium]
MQKTETVARKLLGKVLVRVQSDTVLAGRIVEVEAYLGPDDPASHAFRGLSKRNASMFLQGGTCYVYLSYGVHYCVNVATGRQGVGEAVLLRALEPLAGEGQMRRNRKLRDKNHFGISNGPGKLTQAFSIDLRFDGKRFDREDFKLVDLGESLGDKQVAQSPRIGISKAKERLLRFYDKTSPWVSR